jgi:putative Mg2+ transporter-C (MgtC) family protein
MSHLTTFAVDADVVERLLTATALGAAIGAERETSEQPAGLRTHITVCVGAALFGIISTLGFSEYIAARNDTNVNIDVTRVASQVVVGIGFIGAGMIFRQGTLVRNLTTAASLWVTSAIGLAAGVGDLGSAAVTTLLIVGGLVLLRPLRSWLRHNVTRDERRLRILLRPGVAASGVIDAIAALDGIEVERCSLEKELGSYVVVVDLKGRRRMDLAQALVPLVERDDVESAGEV